MMIRLVKTNGSVFFLDTVIFGQKYGIVSGNRSTSAFTPITTKLMRRSECSDVPIADVALATPFGIKRPPTEAVSIIHGFAQTRTI